MNEHRCPAVQLALAPRQRTMQFRPTKLCCYRNESERRERVSENPRCGRIWNEFASRHSQLRASWAAGVTVSCSPLRSPPFKNCAAPQKGGFSKSQCSPGRFTDVTNWLQSGVRLTNHLGPAVLASHGPTERPLLQRGRRDLRVVGLKFAASVWALLALISPERKVSEKDTVSKPERTRTNPNEPPALKIFVLFIPQRNDPQRYARLWLPQALEVSPAGPKFRQDVPRGRASSSFVSV